MRLIFSIQGSFFIVLLAMLLSCTVLHAQSAQKHFRKGEHHFRSGEYDFAVKEYLQGLALSENPALSKSLHFKTAESYRLSNRTDLALTHYLAVKDTAWLPEHENAAFFLALAYMHHGEYGKASDQLREYLTLPFETLRHKERGMLMVRNLEHILQNPLEPNTYIELHRLDSLNSAGSEYGTFVQSDPENGMRIYFTKSQEEPVYAGTGKGFTSIFCWHVADSLSHAGTLEPLDLDFGINAPFNVGSPAIDKAGKTLVVARGSSAYKRDKKLKEVSLYICHWQDTAWSAPEPLPFSGPDTWDSCPIFSEDGTTLYFASNRPGGYGGIDLYRAKRNRKGEWTEPQNLGNKINTAGNEMFPWVSPEGQLYFASDGHPGLGGLDIFVATRSGSRTDIKHTGEKFNSPYDDFGLVYHTEKTGYFTSNRPGSKGDDDLWFFVDRTPPNFNYGLEVALRYSKDAADRDGNFFAGEPVLGADVVVLRKKPPVTLSTEQAAQLSRQIVNRYSNTLKDSLLDQLTAEVQTAKVEQYRNSLGESFRQSLEAKEGRTLAREYVNQVRDSLVSVYQQNVRDSLRKVHQEEVLAMSAPQIAQFALQVQDSLSRPIITDEYEEVGSFTTGKYGVTKVEMEPGEEYTFVMSKEGALTKRATYAMPKLDSMAVIALVEAGITDTLFTADFELENARVGDVIDMSRNNYDLEDIYYDYDEHIFDPKKNQHLSKLVNFLKDNPSLKIELSSHCDDRGGDMYNLILSQRRANYAIEFLQQQGIPRERLVARGYGKFSLRVANALTEEEHQENRRTELRILSIAPTTISEEEEAPKE